MLLLIGLLRSRLLQEQAQVVLTMSPPTTWSIRRWTKTLVFLNPCRLHFLSPPLRPYRLRFLSPPLHPHLLRLLRILPLFNLRKQVDQSVIIGYLLAMRTLILSLCHHSRNKMRNQLQCCHGCALLCAIDCGLRQTHLACSDNTFTGPPSIPTLLFPAMIFTELKESTMYPHCHHLLHLFIGTNRLKCL